jgi:hypothetical protein
MGGKRRIDEESTMAAWSRASGVNPLMGGRKSSLPISWSMRPDAVRQPWHYSVGPASRNSRPKGVFMNATTIKTLAHEHIRDLLIGFAAAIELDQIRVDALPPEKFHRWYSDSMWRNWRRGHVEYINRLLPTVNTIPSAPLQELAWLAITHDPAVVGEAAVNLFSEAVSGSCPAEELETAALFFGGLIKDVSDRPARKLLNCDARALMMQWLAVTDPQWIAKDPECGYGHPGGFVS